MRLLLTCTLAVFALLLVGCGGKKSASSNGEASKSAAQITADAKSAIAGATSVHVTGDGTAGGAKLARDLIYETGKNSGSSGHVSVSGLGFDIIRVNGKSYFKGAANFLLHFTSKDAAQLMAGKWFYVAGTWSYVADIVIGFSSLAALTNPTALTDAIFSTAGSVSKGAETTIDGQPAIAIVAKNDDATPYVATTGPAYPLEIKPGGGGAIKFDDWNRPVSLTAPKNPIDYAKLAAKLIGR